MSVLTPYDPAAGRVEAGDMWTLWKRGQPLRCKVATHPLGWELRQQQGDAVSRTQVCKTQKEVFDLADDWRVEAIGRGWQPLE
jgi:hypothetical protein